MKRAGADVRMSLQTLRVLDVFLEAPQTELSGADVLKRIGMASGTLYPILLHLEAAGWFESRWASVESPTPGRPRRRLYRLTRTGLRQATRTMANFTHPRGLPA